MPKNEKQLQKLRSALAAAGMATAGEPVSSRYNSPFFIAIFAAQRDLVEPGLS